MGGKPKKSAYRSMVLETLSGRLELHNTATKSDQLKFYVDPLEMSCRVSAYQFVQQCIEVSMVQNRYNQTSGHKGDLLANPSPDCNAVLIDFRANLPPSTAMR
ncbi:hypothetical protein T265_01047 [Opisthorchis viverrini]|uniref:Uncharacterized protein n=1 Tax=Opisthorchis viverrini TaxID=6198 RepID=A0A075AJ87_OPIVI|nr:hypothetical protein T265_01047 [Opisthorchis viverrini]KER32954.1 hypothetical protein T265_01047 [Opisthorchis viverrini]